MSEAIEPTEAQEEILRANRRLTESQAFMLRVLAAAVVQAGGALVISAQAQNEAVIDADPTILTSTDPENGSLRVTIGKYRKHE